MKIDLTSIKNNPLFNRNEVEFKVEQASTPNRNAVRIDLAVALKVELNQVYVRKINTISGTRTTVGYAHVYDDPEQGLKIEPKHIIKRNTTKSKTEDEEE